MSKEWFISSQGNVSGPYATQEVHADLSAGRWTNDCFIWWKGQREWMTLLSWRAHLAKILNQEKEEAAQIWYLDINSQQVGPLTRHEMLSQLRALPKSNKVRLWTEGFTNWTPLFELHEIMDDLGLNRREHERAPVMGTVAIKHAGSIVTSLAQAATISTEGMGLNKAGFLTKGEDIQLVIKCTELGQLHLTGAVAYITPQGYAGIRFANVSPEVQSIIFDYCRRFQSVGKAA